MRTIGVAGLVAAAICACGDDDEGRRQDAGGQLDAGDVDARPEGPDAAQPPDAGPRPEPPGLTWRDCYDDVRCATLEVPLDHDDPSLGTIELAIGRIAARRPAQRIGTLLLLSGGPAPSVANIPLVRTQLSLLLPQVFNRFDLVTFDVRGMADTHPHVLCRDDADRARFDALDLTPDDDAELAAVYAYIDGVLPRCVEQAGRDLLARLDARSVARDMDLVREALGEERLDVLGLSFGTGAGAMYVTTFPDRVRAVVLDSPRQMAGDRLEGMRARAAGHEEALERFAAWCAAEESCPLRSDPARDAEAILAIIDELVAQADATPLPAGDGQTVSQTRLLGAIADGLAAGHLLWGTLAGNLAEAVAGDASALAPGGPDGVFDLVLQDGTAWDNTDAATAIVAVDLPFEADLTREQYDAFVADELSVLAPRMGALVGGQVRSQVAWPVRPARSATPLDATGAPPVLLLAGEHDPATPAQHAFELRDALGNGSHLVTHAGEGHIAIMQSPCAREAALAFLLDPTSPPTRTACPAGE